MIVQHYFIGLHGISQGIFLNIDFLDRSMIFFSGAAKARTGILQIITKVEGVL